MDKKLVKRIIFLLIVFSLGGIVLYYLIAMGRIPYDNADFGETEEIVVLPERPGTQSLILTGPIIRPLIFTLDFRRSKLQAINWEEIRNIDPTADVRITAMLTPEGTLKFDSIRDIYSPGHTRAGQMFARAVRTWAYTPYMTGTIIFTFRVGAVGKKVTIDISRLQRKAGLDPDVPIRTGKLYLIENGLSPKEVKIKTW